jgi:hypothetical protein
MVIKSSTMPSQTDEIAGTRTPQNTPANQAPISSRATAPGVGSIKEGLLEADRSPPPIRN